MTRWTRNQKIMLIGMIISAILSIMGLLISIHTMNKQIVINQDINNLKSDFAEFQNLNATNVKLYNLSIGDVRSYWNGTCYNTDLNGTTAWSMCY